MLRKIKKAIIQNWDLNFEPEDWEKVKLGTNCYAYALNSLYSSTSTSIYEVGGIAKLVNPKLIVNNNSVHDLEQNLFADCRALDISVCACSRSTMPKFNEHLICVVWNESEKAYHFLRRDANGTWSHKYDWFALPTNVYLNDLITNPEVPFARYGYSLAGYYLISK